VVIDDEACHELWKRGPFITTSSYPTIPTATVVRIRVTKEPQKHFLEVLDCDDLSKPDEDTHDDDCRFVELNVPYRSVPNLGSELTWTRPVWVNP